MVTGTYGWGAWPDGTQLFSLKSSSSLGARKSYPWVGKLQRVIYLHSEYGIYQYNNHKVVLRGKINPRVQSAHGLKHVGPH